MRRAYDGNCYNATSESGVDLTRSIEDRGDLRPRPSWEASAESYLSTVEALWRGGKTPFIIGGDHAITIPVARGLRVLEQPTHVIQVDAHPDLYPEFEGDLDSHACTGARLLEMPHIASLTQLGIRTMCDEQSGHRERYQDRLFQYEAKDLQGPLPRLDHIPRDAAVYITIDMDGFDPAFAPGVSHAVPGGLSARQVLSFLQAGHWTLVGMDVVEVNPSRDIQFQTSILAARLLHEGVGYAAKCRKR